MNIKELVVPEGTKEITLYEGITPEPLALYDYQGFQYTATSVQSFVELVRRKGNKENAVIFGDGKGFYGIMDDKVIDRDQDSVAMPFELSVQAREWGTILTQGESFKLKEMIDFFKRRSESEIENLQELLYAIKNFKYVSNLSGDFTYDSNNNYTFMVKVAEADGTVRIPQAFNANIEIFKDSNWIQCIEIEVEIQKPKAQDEPLLFTLSCPKYRRYYEDAKTAAFSEMKSQLNDWLVIDGSATQKKN